jgi:hypothetical protein
MPTSLTPPALEVVLPGLHESEIQPVASLHGSISAVGPRRRDVYGTIVGDRQVWPAADRIAAWMHETALRLFPDSPYAKSHTG